MELHIREFEYQNIIKQQFYKQLVVLSLYVLLLVFALESILYGFDYVWIILFVTSMAIINLNFRRKKKILGYDLVYIDENNRVRQAMRDDIDWQGDAVELVGQIFSQSRNLVSSSKILAEWYNPAISDELHSYYSSEKGKDANPFHQFLVETFTNRMLAEGYSQEKIQEVLQVYQLFYYMDTHITEEAFPHISQTIETLATYFVKGLFK